MLYLFDWLKGFIIKLIMESKSSWDFSFLEAIQMALKLTFKYLPFMFHSKHLLHLLYYFEWLLISNPRFERLQIKLYYSKLALLQPFHLYDPDVDVAVAVQSKLQAKASLSSWNVLVRKGSSGVAVPRARIICLLGRTDMTDKVVPFCVIVGQHFGQALIFLDNLQQQTAIRLNWRIGVDFQTGNDKIEVAMTVSLKN